MKLVSLLFLCLGLAVTAAEAKYNPPAEGKVRSRSQEIAAYQMREFDEDGDGVLTVEVSEEERAVFIRKMRDEGNYFY